MPMQCKQRHQLNNSKDTSAMMVQLLCAGRTGLDIVDIVITSQLSRHHHHPHPHCLLIVVFTAQGLATADVIIVVAADGVPTAPTTAAEDDSITAVKGG